MKEDRIVEYKIEHTNTGNFRNLFEVLGQVLHEVRLTHIKPLKPVRNDEDSNSESESSDKEEDTDKEDSDKDNSNDSESNSESESEKDPKKKINDKKKAILGKKPIQWDNSKKDQGGIKILEINDFKSIIVHVRLHAEQFYKFDCK
jgi:hypothetical protein